VVLPQQSWIQSAGTGMSQAKVRLDYGSAAAAFSMAVNTLASRPRVSLRKSYSTLVAPRFNGGLSKTAHVQPRHFQDRGRLPANLMRRLLNTIQPVHSVSRSLILMKSLCFAMSASPADPLTSPPPCATRETVADRQNGIIEPG
jgi:hypothetical protein